MPALGVTKTSTDLALSKAQIAKPWPAQMWGVATETMDFVSYMDLASRRDGYRTLDNRLAFEGETILITGASSGIGKACAVFFAELGAKVINIDKFPANFVNEADKPGKIISYEQDLSDHNAVYALVTQIGRDHGITKLVLNAGFFPGDRPTLGKEVVDFTKQFGPVMAVNGLASTCVLYAAAPFLLDKANLEKDVVVIATGSKNLAEGTHGPYTSAMAYRSQMVTIVDQSNRSRKSAAMKSGTTDDYIHIRAEVISPDAVLDTGVYGGTPEQRLQKIGETAKAAGMSVDEFIKFSNTAGLEFSSWTTARHILGSIGPWSIGRNSGIIRLDGDRTLLSNW